jgi:predicted CXXCH cytochrome family protein
MNDGKPLSCMDCHVMNADGEHFAPITMQNACASCHDLAFDPTNPARQLPHDKPREVIQMLQEYYAAKYLDPVAARAAMSTVERRRIPGREDEEAGCDAPPMVCARRETARQIDIQFNVRGCVTCHQVVDTQSSDIVERYQVMPVRLSSNYYPAARFPHNSHLIQGMLSGDDACASCHGARAATESAVVMIPGIDHCLSCHSSRSADRKLGSGSNLKADSSESSNKESIRLKVEGHGGNIKLGCVECHRYHPGKRQAAITPNTPITSTN